MSLCLYFFTDRLQAVPPFPLREFILNGSFPLSARQLQQSEIRLKVRVRRGPGRYVGSSTAYVSGLRLIISLYELHNETDAHALRIVIYEAKHSQTVEYRLSPMERLTLFTDDKPLFDQIVGRLRTVYCETSVPTRAIIRLDSKPKVKPPTQDDVEQKYKLLIEADPNLEDSVSENSTEDQDEDINESHSQSEKSAASGSHADSVEDDSRKEFAHQPEQLLELQAQY